MFWKSGRQTDLCLDWSLFAFVTTYCYYLNEIRCYVVTIIYCTRGHINMCAHKHWTNIFISQIYFNMIHRQHNITKTQLIFCEGFTTVQHNIHDITFSTSQDNTWAPSQYRKPSFPRMGIPMAKIGRSRDRLIFNMGSPIVVRHLYIEMAPWLVLYLSWRSSKLSNR